MQLDGRSRWACAACRSSTWRAATSRSATRTSSVWVVQNGEIYNHLELRALLLAAGHTFYTQSDTEVLVHGYEEWGEDLVGRLNGMFAFALVDRARGALFLARDRMGIKPLHYAIDGSRLVFASELKALLRDPSLRKGIDPVALDEYLAYEFVPSPRSIVLGVSKLQPGHTLTWSIKDGSHRLRRYWAPELNVDGASRNRTLDEECDELRTVLRESVRKELISDVPVGVFLSGGIDSSAVTAMMTRLGGNVKSFSVGFAERSFDEAPYAREVARHLGTEHHELTLEPDMLLGLIPRLPTLLDEPLGDASIIPTYLLSAFTRRHVKVALGGDGGDELFAGYPTLQAHRLAGYYMRAPRLLREGLVEPVVRRLPVSRDNLSFDFRAKRFVGGAGYPVAERHQRWMGSFAPEERAALLSGDVREQLSRHGADSAVDEATSLDPLNHVLMMDMRHVSRERHPRQARPVLDDGLAGGPRALAEQRSRRIRDAAAAQHEAARPALEIHIQAGAAWDPARPHPGPAQEGFRHPSRALVSRSAQRADAVGAFARAHRA